jgi:hypothetical protein
MLAQRSGHVLVIKWIGKQTVTVIFMYHGDKTLTFRKRKTEAKTSMHTGLQPVYGQCRPERSASSVTFG